MTNMRKNRPNVITNMQIGSGQSSWWSKADEQQNRKLVPREALREVFPFLRICVRTGHFQPPQNANKSGHVFIVDDFDCFRVGYQHEMNPV